MESSEPHEAIRASRIRAWEIVVWLVALAMWFVAPKYAPLFNEIAILALFAVSLDLILGYGGIVSLGHAAFFGTGAYVAALFAKHVSWEGRAHVPERAVVLSRPWPGAASAHRSAQENAVIWPGRLYVRPAPR